MSLLDRILADASPQAASDDDGTSGPEDDEDVGFIVPNGRAPAKADLKHRSASSSIHDRNLSSVNFAATSNSRPSSAANNTPFHHGPTPTNAFASNSSNGHSSPHHLTVGGIPPFASPYGASPSSASAKESFLNYFFGESEMSSPGSSMRTRSALPEIGHKGDNPLSGRRGLEGNAAAFDMKSLDKHLEAVRPSPSPRPRLIRY